MVVEESGKSMYQGIAGGYKQRQRCRRWEIKIGGSLGFQVVDNKMMRET
jgi:hypothetical protein